MSNVRCGDHAHGSIIVYSSDQNYWFSILSFSQRPKTRMEAMSLLAFLPRDVRTEQLFAN